jgi:hypothetical protein
MIQNAVSRCKDFTKGKSSSRTMGLIELAQSVQKRQSGQPMQICQQDANMS